MPRQSARLHHPVTQHRLNIALLPMQQAQHLKHELVQDKQLHRHAVYGAFVGLGLRVALAGRRGLRQLGGLLLLTGGGAGLSAAYLLAQRCNQRSCWASRQPLTLLQRLLRLLFGGSKRRKCPPGPPMPPIDERKALAQKLEPFVGGNAGLGYADVMDLQQPVHAPSSSSSSSLAASAAEAAGEGILPVPAPPQLLPQQEAMPVTPPPPQVRGGH